MAPDRDLGEKHACNECDTLFYDLLAEEPACPNCGALARPAPKAPAPRKAADEDGPEAEAPEAIEEDEAEAEEDEDGEGDEASKIAGRAGASEDGEEE